MSNFSNISMIRKYPTFHRENISFSACAHVFLQIYISVLHKNSAWTACFIIKHKDDFHNLLLMIASKLYEEKNSFENISYHLFCNIPNFDLFWTIKDSFNIQYNLRNVQGKIRPWKI